MGFGPALLEHVDQRLLTSSPTWLWPGRFDWPCLVRNLDHNPVSIKSTITIKLTEPPALPLVSRQRGFAPDKTAAAMPQPALSRYAGWTRLAHALCEISQRLDFVRSTGGNSDRTNQHRSDGAQCPSPGTIWPGHWSVRAGGGHGVACAELARQSRVRGRG